MVVAQVAQERRHAASDARLAIAVAAAGAVALPVFVLLPFGVGQEWRPPGPDALWFMAAVVAVFLGPVAVGLAGWASLVALWADGVLTLGVRRTHLVTLLLVGAYAAVLAAAWSAGVFAWFSE